MYHTMSYDVWCVGYIRNKITTLYEDTYILVKKNKKIIKTNVEEQNKASAQHNKNKNT